MCAWDKDKIWAISLEGIRYNEKANDLIDLPDRDVAVKVVGGREKKGMGLLL